MLTPSEIKTADKELLQFLKPFTEYSAKAIGDLNLTFRRDDDCVVITPEEIYDSPREFGEIRPGYIHIPLKWDSNDESDSTNDFIFIPTKSKGVIAYRCYLPPYCDQDGDASLFNVAWYPSVEAVKPIAKQMVKDSLKSITEFLKILNTAANATGLDFQHSILDASMAEAFDNWNAK